MKITPKLLQLQYGDLVEVTLDKGQKRLCGVENRPYQVSRTWLIKVLEIGSPVLLKNCHKITMRPATHG